MLLYKDSKGRYLAIRSDQRFVPCHGYEICYEGQHVPDIICEAFIREYGGFVIVEDCVEAA